MHYIDEMYPWTIDGARKYQLYLEFRRQRYEFLKSLREMSYTEWKIDKTLVEAGGIGKTVYILPARGQGTSERAMRQFIRFLEEGRDVRFVTTKKLEPKLSVADIERTIETMMALDKWEQQRNAYLDLHIKNAVKRDPEKNRVWITSARPDSYIFDWKAYAEKALNRHV